MTKTEKKMMNSLNGLEEIEKDEDLNLSEWIKVTTNYDDFFEHETISKIEDQAAMDEDNIPSKIIDNSVIENISKEKDLKIKAGVNINPPPKDGWCDCCGRHISELTPFGKAGNPLVGDFDGELLVKKFRPSGPYDEQAENAWDRVEKLMEKEGRAGEIPLDMMIKIYGKEEGEKYYWSYQLFDQIGKSCECRDCAVLSLDNCETNEDWVYITGKEGKIKEKYYYYWECSKMNNEKYKDVQYKIDLLKNTNEIVQINIFYPGDYDDAYHKWVKQPI